MAKTKSAKTTKAQKNELKKNIRLWWKIVFSGIGLVILLFLLAAWGAFGSLPDHTILENPQTDLATEIVTVDGETLGKIYSAGGNRTPVTYEDLPQNLVDALISTEDERFLKHSGIDGYGTVRAFAFLGKRGGASTITQQLAKLYFTDQRSSNILERGIQKIQEWIIATRLEKQYTKEEIVVQYLNTMDFLKGAIGIRSASNIYFDKEPIELNKEESAVLVGMLKNPRQFNPAREISKEKSKIRRNVVLAQMFRNEKLTIEEKDSLQKLPLKINYSPQSHNHGMGTYFREYLREWLTIWASETVNPDTGKNYNLYNDGLKVNVTIDSRLQQYAEDAVIAHMQNLQKELDEQNENLETAPFRDLNEKQIKRTLEIAMKRSERWKKMKRQEIEEDEIIASFNKKTDMTIFSWTGENREIDTVMTPMDSIRYYKKFLHAGIMSIDPQTGHVKAWVGGINHKHFKYDHVKKGKRQVGSTFKPFLYATAVDLLKYSPCKELPDGEYTIPAGKHGNQKEWTPKNSDGNYGNIRTLKNALAYSVNTISARLMDDVGPQPVIDLVSRLGINTIDFPAVPSLALGAADASLFEMVGAYGVFPNQGIYNTPVMVTSIEDKNGTILYQYMPETKDVMNPETAYVTLKLMEGVTTNGSGSRLRHSWAKENKFYKEIITGYPYEFTNSIAGKTGTTQNNSDGWFMGIVPNLVTGCWVGGEDRSVRFRSTRYGQGASMALPIWGSYMKAAYADKTLDISKSRFQKPENLSIETDCGEFKKEQQEDKIDDSSEELGM